MIDPRPEITDPTPDRRAAWGFGFRQAEGEDYIFPSLADHLASPEGMLTPEESAAWISLGAILFYEWASAGWRAGMRAEAEPPEGAP